MNPAKEPQRSVKICLFFSVILGCLQQDMVKFYHKNLKKIVTNMKLAFTNVPFRHNSSCVMINKWLRFKLVIRVRLAYISEIFPNGCI